MSDIIQLYVWRNGTFPGGWWNFLPDPRGLVPVPVPLMRGIAEVGRVGEVSASLAEIWQSQGNFISLQRNITRGYDDD